jgi:hypothetical protein
MARSAARAIDGTVGYVPDVTTLVRRPLSEELSSI